MKKTLVSSFIFITSLIGYGQVMTISQTTNTGHWYSVNGYVGAQSFTINQAGYLTEIKFNTLGAEGSTVFEVRQGQDIAGPLLYSTNINVTAAGWFSVPLPNIPVCEGVYCFTQYYNDFGSLNISDPYPGGMAYFGGGWTASLDQEFEVWQTINEEPVTPTTFVNQFLCSGQSMPLINYTITDENPNIVVASAVSSNPGVVPNPNIILGGTGAARTISLSGPVTTPGTTTITLTLSDGLCSNNYTFNIQVNPLPSVSAGPDQFVCNGASVTLSGSGTAVSYGWTGGVVNGSPFVPVVGTQSYTVTGIDVNGCQNTDAVTVTTYALPAVNFAAVPAFCIDGSPYTLTQGTPAGGNYSGPGIAGGIFNPATAGVGSHAVNYTYTDGNGCINSAAQTIVVNNLPVVTFSPLADICLNASPLALTGGSPAGGTYSGTAVAGGTFNPTTAGIGSHVMTYNFTDGNGCTNSATSPITVLTLPTVNAGSDITVCSGDPVTLNAGGSAVSYAWDSGVSDGVAFIPPVGITTYTLTGTGANGCTNTDMIDVNALNLPVVSFGATPAFCPDAVAYTLIEGTPAGGSYTGTGISAGSFDPAVAGVGSHNATYTYTDGNGCTNFANQTITVNAFPVLNFPPLSSVCITGTPFTMTGATPVGGSYSGPGMSAGIFDPAVAGTGVHTITYDYTDGVSGCSNQIQQTILVYSAPVVIANATFSSLCDGESTILTGSGASSYIWDNGATDGVAIVPPVGTTTYTVTGTDVNGCLGTDQINITVNALPVVTTFADQTLCEGSAITLSGSGADSYAWNNGVMNGVAFVPPVGTTTYIVTGTDLNNCQNTDSINVTVEPMPVMIVSPDQYFCAGDSVTLTASGVASYNWNSGAATTSSYTIYPTATTAVQIAGTSGMCTVIQDIILTLDDPALVGAGNDVAICPGFSAYLNGTGGGTYLWNGPNVTNVTDQTIGVIVDTTAYYYLEVVTANNCVYTDSVLITSSSDPSCTIAPVTSFTPNGDAVNDSWRIQGIEGFPLNHVVILNRWGDTVFEEDNYDNQTIIWNGTMPNGTNAPEGTYFFIVEITNGPAVTGWIQLLE